MEKDETSLFDIAKSLMTIQALYGIIPNIYGKGHCAKVSVGFLNHLLNWHSKSVIIMVNNGDFIRHLYFT